MRFNQSKSLRWFLAELLVIVLGISIAFQVEEWRQHREIKALEVKALHEVLGDLDSMESSILAAVDTYENSANHAIQLFQVIDSGSAGDSAGESVYLDHLSSINVYLIGEAEDQFAYEGLLDEGRFANVDAPELTSDMRTLFTVIKPWIFSLNVRHIALHDDFKEGVYRDLRRVPDADFASSGKSHYVISVPIDEFMASPGARSELLGYIDSTGSMIEKFHFIQQKIGEVRLSIRNYLDAQSSA